MVLSPWRDLGLTQVLRLTDRHVLQETVAVRSAQEWLGICVRECVCVCV